MLGVGLGWAAGEMFFSHLLMFIVNAGGGEFSWDYLQRAIGANCSLFQLIVLACLVNIRGYSAGFYSLAATALLIAQVIARPLLIGFALHSGLVTNWSSLIIQASWSLVLVLTGKILIEASS